MYHVGLDGDLRTADGLEEGEHDADNTDDVEVVPSQDKEPFPATVEVDPYYGTLSRSRCTIHLKIHLYERL